MDLEETIELAGRRVLVLGMARSGIAAMRLLRQHGAEAVACDVRPLEDLGETAPIIEELAADYFVQAVLCEAGFAAAGADMIVLSPGVPADLPLLNEARAARIPVIGETELAATYLQGPVLGITGTNGKTTTTALTGHLLEVAGLPVQVGGNIGTPVCEMVATSRPDQWNVLELSSFQLETTSSLSAQIAVCLNVTPDHLDRHHSFDAYTAAKRRLFELQMEGSHAVLNGGDAVSLRYGFVGPAMAHLFGLDRAAGREVWLEGEQILYQGQPLLSRQQIPLPGLHNVENVMAASLSALLAGAKPEQVARGVSSFPGVEHRLEFVRERRGVRWVNDSKATNVDAALKAVASFTEPLWLILGGRDKQSDYRPLGKALEQRPCQVLLVGEAAALIEQQISSMVTCQHCGTLDAAVARAASTAPEGSVVLLAPACASFDQFTSYGHRGSTFKQLVMDLED
jgi:UDP-N-acetylmuramoylalanine--D-glutamate ligase